MKNEGKIFEDDFKKSVPEGVYCKKLHDSANGFDIENSKQRFALQSPYDFLLCKDGQMYAYELKTAKGSSFSFKGKSPNIKMRQIDELILAKRSGAKTGLILNFREKEQTYVLDPDDFKAFTESTTKSSINIKEAEEIGYKLGQEKPAPAIRYEIDPNICQLTFLSSDKDLFTTGEGRVKLKISAVEELLKKAKKKSAYLILKFASAKEAYIIEAKAFLEYVSKNSKREFDIDDAKNIGKQLEQKQMRAHYKYDVESLLSIA